MTRGLPRKPSRRAAERDAAAAAPAARGLAPALCGMALALVAGRSTPAAAVVARPPSVSSSEVPVAQAPGRTEMAGGRTGSIGNAPPRGSSADLYGGSSADRYGGSSADKGGVAGERDSRVHGKPRSTRKEDNADRARKKKESDQDQDIEEK